MTQRTTDHQRAPPNPPGIISRSTPGLSTNLLWASTTSVLYQRPCGGTALTNCTANPRYLAHPSYSTA